MTSDCLFDLPRPTLRLSCRLRLIELFGTARHRACAFKPDLGRLIGRTKGGMDTELCAIGEAKRRPFSVFMTAGLVNDYTGAAAMLDDLPKAQWLLGGRGC